MASSKRNEVITTRLVEDSPMSRSGGRRKLKPVSIGGIEFDALIDETKNYNATIPKYAVEDGFPVSDTIILDPLSLQMTLYVSNTPVTWLYRHGSSVDRVNKICDEIEEMWLDKKLVKIVTTDNIYKSMGLLSISIRKSSEIGYAREISLQAQKVYITKRKKTKIPAKILKSGKTKAKAGSASTSKSSKKSGNGKDADKQKTPGSSKNISSSKSSSSKKSSVLYKAAKGLGIM